MRANGIAVPPRLVVDVVLVVVRETAVHALAGVEQTLIELRLAGVTLGRHSKGNLLAHVPLALPLQPVALLRRDAL